jgi:hypothetical protein
MVEASFDPAERDDAGYRANMAWLLSRDDVSRNDVHQLLSTMLAEDWTKVAKAVASKKANQSSEPLAVFEAAIKDCLELMLSAFFALADEQSTSQDDTFEFVDRFWARFDLQTVLIHVDAIDNARAIAFSEVDSARRSLATVRKIIGRCIELTSGPLDRRLAILAQLAFMTSLGWYLANQLIICGRRQPHWPVFETITALHDFAMRIFLATTTKSIASHSR